MQKHIMKKWVAIVIVLLLGSYSLVTVPDANAYNKPWDQGHDSIKPEDPKAPESPCEEPCDKCKSTASPVFLTDGNLVKKFVDFSSSGNIPIRFERTYNSKDNMRTGFFGFGWTMSFESKILEVENGESGPHAIILMPNGKRYTFIKDPDGSYTSPKQNISLFKTLDDTYELYIAPDELWTYNTAGMLVQVEDGKGNSIQVSYTDSCISQITNNSNQQLTFTKGVNGKIEHILYNGKTHAYGYDPNGNLTSYTDPENNQTTYQYDSNHNLTAIIDPNGNTIASYTYDATTGRVLSYSKHGVVFQYTYISDAQTKITDPNGNDWLYDFDGNGVVTQITAPDGTTEIYTYDDKGNLNQLKDRNGNITSFTHDNLGNVLTRTDALGNVTTYQYDEFGHKIAEQDALGNTIGYTYDENGLVTDINYPNGTTLHFEYDAFGRKTGVVDPEGHVLAAYVYDDDGNLVGLTNATGEVFAKTYDDSGNLLTEIDPAGGTTTFEYDDNNRLTKKIDTLGNETTYEYDAAGNIKKLIEPGARTYEFTYDQYNRLTAIKDPSGGQTASTYNNFGRIASQTDSNGNTTQYTYDPNHLINGLIKDITRTVGGRELTTSMSYDSNGNLISTTDPSGNTSSFSYNAINQKTGLTVPTGEGVQYQYDAAGNLLSVTSPSGGQRTFTYNAAGQVVAIHENGTAIATYQYDQYLRKISETDLSGNVTYFQYDLEGRQTRFISSDGSVTTIDYNASGRIGAFNTPDGKTISLQYYQDGKVKSYTDGLGNTYSATYDSNGNVTSITDPNGNVIGFTYDSLNRKIEEIHPDGSKNQFEYDANGNLTKSINPDGTSVSIDYDERNLLTRRTYSSSGSPDDVFTYYDNGTMKSASKGGWVVDYTYDAFGRLLAENQDGKIVAYAWDLPNRKKTITYPGGKVINKFYDQQIRQTRIEDNAGNHLAAFTWSTDGVMSNIAYINGVVGTASLNSNRRLHEIAYSKGGSDHIRLEYKYNQDNQLILEKNNTHANQSVEFNYDANDRLVKYKRGIDDGNQVTAPTSQIDYTLDPLSNWITVDGGVAENRTANNLNEYTNVGGVNYSYSINGELTNDGTHLYAYDELGRLTEIKLASDGSVVATYLYDALGRRVAKTVHAVTTHFFYDSNLNVIEERNAIDDSVLATYVYNQNYYGPGYSRLLQMERGANTYYYHQDIRGNVLYLSDETGNIIESYQYDPYGNFTVQNGGNSYAESQVSNPYAFSGRRFDTESGFYYYRNRYYSPELGRFTTRDPAGYQQGMNLFEYVRSNPVTSIDPMGLGEESCAPVNIGGGLDLGGMGLGKYVEALSVAKKLDKAWNKIAKKAKLGGLSFGLNLGGSLEFCNKDCCTKNVTKNISYYKGKIELKVSASSPRMPLGGFGVVANADYKEDENSFMGVVWSVGIDASGWLVVQPVFIKGCVLDYKVGEVCVGIQGWVKIEAGIDITIAGTGAKALAAGQLAAGGKVCHNMKGWMIEFCVGGTITGEAGVKLFWVEVGSVTVTVANGQLCWNNQTSFGNSKFEIFGNKVF